MTGVVLSGGKSTRMGKDKGLVMYRNAPLISHALKILSSQLSEVLISTNNTEYSIFNYPLIADIIPEIGPLGGIFSAMDKLNSDGYLFMACDIPEFGSDILGQMLDSAEQADVVFLEIATGNPQPLPVYLGAGTYYLMKKMIGRHDYKLQNIFSYAKEDPDLKVKTVMLDQELRNINKPTDLE